MTNFGMPGSELIAHQIGDAMDKLIDLQMERLWAIPSGRDGQALPGDAEASPPSGDHPYRKERGT